MRRGQTKDTDGYQHSSGQWDFSDGVGGFDLELGLAKEQKHSMPCWQGAAGSREPISSIESVVSYKTQVIASGWDFGKSLFNHDQQFNTH